MTTRELEIIKLAAYYEKILTDDQVRMYAEDLSSLSVEETALACKLYRSNPKNEFFPRPMAKLVEAVRNPISTEDLGQNLTSVMIEAVSKYGHHWDSGFFQGGEIIYSGKNCAFRDWRHAAISVFGDVGLKLVDRQGGWKNFCELVHESPDGVIRKQISSLASTIQKTNNVIGNTDAVLSLTSETSNVLPFTIKELEKWIST